MKPEGNGGPAIGTSDETRASPAKGLKGGRLRLGQAAFASFYADAVLALIAILVVPYLVRRLGTEPYGILGIVSVLAGQLGVLHFGVGTAATRLVADSVGRGGDALRYRLRGIAMVGGLASLLVGTVFLFLAPAAWRSGFNVSSTALPLALAAVPAGAALVALTPASAAVYGVLTAREYFGLAAGLRVFQGAGRMFAAVAAVALGGGVVGVFWSQAAVDLIAVGIGGRRAWRQLPESPPRHVVQEATRGRLRSLRGPMLMALAVGLPFALVSLFNGLLSDAEKLAIALARSVEDFTYYSVPFNAVVKFTVISGAVVRVLMPRVASLGAGGGQAEAVRLTEQADRILVVGMVGVLAPFVVLAPELLDLWVGADFALRSTLPARILLVGMAINAAAFPAHAVVLARGRPILLTALYGIEVVFHLGVVFVLVKTWGLVGAATAWTLRVFADTLAQRALASRTLGRPIRDHGAVWGAVALLGALALAASVMDGLVPRVLMGGLVGMGCGAWLAFGPHRRLLFDSLLPWRWGRRGAGG